MHIEYGRTDYLDQYSRSAKCQNLWKRPTRGLDSRDRSKKTTSTTSWATDHYSTNIRPVHRLDKNNKSKGTKPTGSNCAFCFMSQKTRYSQRKES